MLYLIGRIDFTWPIEIGALIRVQDYMVKTIRSLLSADCLILSTGKPPSIKMIYINSLILAFTPALVTLLSYLFWNVINRGQNLQDRSDKHFVTVSIILFFFYPHIIANLAETMLCSNVDGVYRLDIDLT